MRVLWIAIAIGAGACGGDDDSSPSGKCEALESQLCTRITECIPGGAGMQDACIQGIDSTAPCSAVKTIGASYDQCVNLLDSQSCTALFPTDPTTGTPEVTLPQECVGVLQSAPAPTLGVRSADPFARVVHRAASVIAPPAR
jgi:hypothetical protein